jgi:hypothetical protein
LEVLLKSQFTGKRPFYLVPFLVVSLVIAVRSGNTQPAQAYWVGNRSMQASPPARSLSTQIAPLNPPQSFTFRRATPLARLDPYLASSNSSVPQLEDFIHRVIDGQSGEPRGLYAPGILALQILPQPAGQPAYIAVQDGTVTRFQNAEPFHTIGLLAHNFLSGREFFRLHTGEDLVVVFGDGNLKKFKITEIADFQRLNQVDLRSDFLELPGNQRISADQLFSRFYQQPDQLTLQTCIERDGSSNWGVRMIRAVPSQ